MPPLLTLGELKKSARENSPLAALVHAQIEKLSLKEASNGKPFHEVILKDASDSLTLRAWADSEAFASCAIRKSGDFVSVEGQFHHNGSFGLDARGWELDPLPDEAAEVLLSGSQERQLLLQQCWETISGAVESLQDPRLRELCLRFLEQHGARFRRSAAARGNHHARRGGLLEHTSRMMECALSLSGVYPELNRDLLIAGVLFHDSGKLWETCPPEWGFGIEPELRGELLGHLSIGIELVNALWRELPKEDWESLSPPSDDVRIHLLHLIASHHGQLEFGSPVLPKTPEAALLHFIDNIDARMEMFAAAYESQLPVNGSTKTTLEWIRPLGVAPVRSLPCHRPEESSSQKTTDFLL